MKVVGLVGWRGMVGSVLMQRMQDEGDFALIEPIFFTTSNVGGKAPAMAKNEVLLKDANSVDELKKCDIIIVSNETGLGVVPPTKLGRFFRDCLGRVNQLIAQEADKVYFMVSGIPMKIK